MKTKLLLLFLVTLSGTTLFSQRSDVTMHWYGFVRNDFFYNSRQNEEAIDGILNLIPRPIVNNLSGKDINDVPQAEMLSVNTRVGVDIKGNTIAGAASSAKIEFDFGGTGTTFFLAQIRHAYMQLDWKKTSLLIGQTWHPMYGSVVPTGVSFNAGAPFQPFNRSPQIRLSHQIFPNITISGTASSQMQHSSGGPLGFSSVYMKNALRPALHGAIEWKYKHFTAGAGLDYKKIKPDHLYLTSLGAVAYAQYVKPTLQIKSKAVVGQNLSELLMSGGYGQYFDSNTGSYNYTNMKVFSSFVNVLFGRQWQWGFFAGYQQNLGSSIYLHPFNGKFTVYGRGFHHDTQQILNHMVRVAPMLIYHFKNFNAGIEYNLTAAEYGLIQMNGKGINPYTVLNHRVVFAVNYFF